MKVIHLCGMSACGKKTLLGHVWNMKGKSEESFTESEQRLLYHLEIEGKYHIWGPFQCKGKYHADRGIEPTKRRFKTDIENDECDTLIHHWQYETDGVFHFVHENHPDVTQKTFLLWMQPSLHVEKIKERLEDAKANNDSRRIGMYSGRDEGSLRRSFTDLYNRLMRPELEGVNIDLNVIENIGTEEHPVLRTIPSEELEGLFDI
ncbi:hypothetical protein Enr10x_23000 [Gimesia panareensis]|uniref:Uncharacterized protein n=1 Tax=Gimesia panareensis TaxID=2527978 RepID=A0A517Q5R1_9PLAN|nr:hypothetical protein [Gimesia panareensis]QDT26987.1 hypothetical protein Enr10x_23000 [Gimesia panareensis]